MTKAEREALLGPIKQRVEKAGNLSIGEMDRSLSIARLIRQDIPTLIALVEQQGMELDGLRAEIACGSLQSQTLPKLSDAELALAVATARPDLVSDELLRVTAERDRMKVKPDGDCWKEFLAVAYNTDDPPLTIMRITADYNAMRKERDRLRDILWLRHGCPSAVLYGDDGKMDCNACLIDFKNGTIDEIERGLKLGLGALSAPQPCPACKGTGDKKLREEMATLSAPFQYPCGCMPTIASSMVGQLPAHCPTHGGPVCPECHGKAGEYGGNGTVKWVCPKCGGTGVSAPQKAEG